MSSQTHTLTFLNTIFLISEHQALSSHDTHVHPMFYYTLEYRLDIPAQNHEEKA